LTWGDVELVQNKAVINQTKIDGISWKKKHWNALKFNYKKAKYYNEISELLYDYFHLKTFEKLSELNTALIRIICQYLNINTKRTFVRRNIRPFQSVMPLIFLIIKEF